MITVNNIVFKTFVINQIAQIAHRLELNMILVTIVSKIRDIVM